jgi:hypothetical protein
MIKSNEGPFYIVFYDENGIQDWVTEDFASDKEVNRFLAQAKNKNKYEVFNKYCKLIYSEY